MDKYDRSDCIEGYELVCIEGSKYSRCICENTTGIDAVLPIRSKSYIWLERL